MTEPESLIDIERVAEAVEKYAETSDRERQRELENEVLAATVWQAEDDEDEDQLVLDRVEAETIAQELPEDAHEAQRLLRRLYVDKL